jgi:chorismate mutase
MTDWSKLTDLRYAIDKIDAEIIAKFGERYHLRDQVIALKRSQGLPDQDPTRVTEVIETAKKNAANNHVPTDFAEALYRLVIDWSHQYEQQKPKE